MIHGAFVGSGQEGLTTSGAIVMIVSIALVLSLVAWCVARILREQDPRERHRVTGEVDRGVEG